MSDKVRQIAVTFDISPRDKLQAVEDALFNVNEAMEALQGIGEYEEWFNALDALYDEMEVEQVAVDREAEGEYRQELADLAREYEREAMW